MDFYLLFLRVVWVFLPRCKHVIFVTRKMCSFNLQKPPKTFKKLIKSIAFIFVRLYQNNNVSKHTLLHEEESVPHVKIHLKWSLGFFEYLERFDGDDVLGPMNIYWTEVTLVWPQRSI